MRTRQVKRIGLFTFSYRSVVMGYMVIRSLTRANAEQRLRRYEAQAIRNITVPAR